MEARMRPGGGEGAAEQRPGRRLPTPARLTWAPRFLRPLNQRPQLSQAGRRLAASRRRKGL